ncbi:MAG: ATP-dependent DNA helicase RecG [Candidatus Kapaibacterium sp.]
MAGPKPIMYVKGVGPRRAAVLESEGIHHSLDMLKYTPVSYIERDASKSIKQLTFDFRSGFSDEIIPPVNFRNETTIVAEIFSKQLNRAGKHRKMLTLSISDESNMSAKVNFWNMTDYFDKIYKKGQMIAVSGKPELDRYGLMTFTHPEIDIIEPEDKELYAKGAILPKYRLTEKMRRAGFSIRLMRGIMEEIIRDELYLIKERLPKSLAEEMQLLDIWQAYKALHFPESPEILEKAIFRMKFEELFFYQLAIGLKKKQADVTLKGITMNPKSPSARKLYDSLPFQLTPDQKKVIREIASDMQSGKPMSRLLQGDVGSGKTIVAVLSALIAIDEGYQAAFMAPTEILAEQHYKNIIRYLEGIDAEAVLIKGSQKTALRRDALERISSGRASVIVGTHALFQNDILYRNLGLIIIDEQHRFGVAQRAELINIAKSSHNGKLVAPHILVMTATPIPRTITMTLYGDLDVSVIKQKPGGRKPIITKVAFDSAREDVYNFIREKISHGNQAYIVYPLVEKSDKLELKAATEHFDFIGNDAFPGYPCGLLHGQMKAEEKDLVMEKFLNKEYKLLISTTVIEVGIDVPNATVMLIEDAERFGLSQLHQLRGRVGRGADQSYCILMTKDHFKYRIKDKSKRDEEQKSAVIRLRTMEATNDGFEIASVDLKLRGPGDILGTKQSGLPDFKFADIVNDGDIITLAREKAFSLINEDPSLKLPHNLAVREHFFNTFAGGRYFDIA